MNHAPLPWKLFKGKFVRDTVEENDGFIFKLTDEDKEFIVRARNSHEKLVNSLRELVNRFEIEGFVPNARFKSICNENLDNGDCRHLRARKALTEAEV